MASLNKIAYRIFNIIRPYITDDDIIDIRQIKEEIVSRRSLFLRNELNKNRTVDPNIEQTICDDLEVADRSVCPSFLTGCHIMRNKRDIPKTIELHNELLIREVGPLDIIEVPFSFISYKRARYAGNGRFNGKTIFAFLYNKRIYLFSRESDIPKYMDKIKIVGVFEDPRDAEDFNNDTNICYNDDMDFPILKWMEDYIVKDIVQYYINLYKLPVDYSNDASFNVVSQEHIKR